MKRILNFSAKNPRLVLTVLLLITMSSIPFLKDIRIDSSLEKAIDKNNPEKKYFDKIKEVFGSDNIISIYIEDEDLATSKKMNILQDLVSDLEDIPEITKIDSIFTTTNFYNNDGVLESLPLFDSIPETDAGVKKLFRRGFKNPLFRKQFLIKEHTKTVILAHVDKTKDDQHFQFNVAKNIDRTINKYKKEVNTIMQIGFPRIHVAMSEGIEDNFKNVAPISIFIILFLFFIMLKTYHAGLIPLFTGLMSTIWTLAIMTIIGIPLQVLVATVPVFIFVMGSTEDTHILSEYFEGLEFNAFNKSKAISHMSHKIGLALLLTGLTTVIGFATIAFNKIELLREFGIISAIGLSINFFVTVTFLPAYLKLFGPEKVPSYSSTTFKSFADKIYTLIHKKRNLIIVLTSIFLILSIISSLNLYSENNFIRHFKKSTSLRKDLKTLTQNFSGINTFFIIIEKEDPKRDDFKEPQNLDRVFKIHQYIDNKSPYDSAQSFAGLIALINREMASDGGKKKELFYKTPESRNLIAQYALLLSRDDIEKYINSDFSKANILVRHNISSSKNYFKEKKKLESKIHKLLMGSNLKFTITGLENLTHESANSITKAQFQSLFFMTLSIFILISIFFSSLKIGLISLIPNLIPITGLFGFMALLNIPLDVGTCMIATMSLGVAADDTIHFFTRYNEYLKLYQDPNLAIKKSIDVEVRPILTTSFALSLGLLGLTFSAFVPIILTGLLSAWVISLALISDLIITPLIISFFKIENSLLPNDILFIKKNSYKLLHSPSFSKFSKKDLKEYIISAPILSYDNLPINITDISSEEIIILEGNIQVSKEDQRGSSPENKDKINLKKYSQGAIINTNNYNNESFSLKAIGYTKIALINPLYLERITRKYPEMAKKFILNLQKN